MSKLFSCRELRYSLSILLVNTIMGGSVSQFSLSNRGKFQRTKHMRQAIRNKCQDLIKKRRRSFLSIEQRFFELTDFLGVREYVTEEKFHPTTHEVMCNVMALWQKVTKRNLFKILYLSYRNIGGCF